MHRRRARQGRKRPGSSSRSRRPYRHCRRNRVPRNGGSRCTLDATVKRGVTARRAPPAGEPAVTALAWFYASGGQSKMPGR
jgi:hypothetical protein